MFPTSEGLNFRLFHADWYHLDVPRHLHFFTHDSFRRLVGACGLRILYRTCRSGTRGLRHSLKAAGGRCAPVGAFARLVKAKPGAWITKVTLKMVDGLRQGDIAEYLLRPGTP
jgi:hypothetical protein